MSQENVEIMRRAFELGVKAGAPFFELFDPDVVEWVTPPASVGRKRTPQSTHPDQVAAALKEARDWSHRHCSVRRQPLLVSRGKPPSNTAQHCSSRLTSTIEGFERRHLLHSH